MKTIIELIELAIYWLFVGTLVGIGVFIFYVCVLGAVKAIL